MAKCPGLVRIVFLLSMLPFVLSMSTIARAANEPVATAAIPPPLPTAPVNSAPAAPKATKAPKAAAATASPAKPSAAVAEAPKRIVRAAALPGIEPAKRAVAQKPSRHARRERHLLFARVYPPPHTPTRPRYYYPGAPVTDPGSDGPPQWYDRGRPLAGYPYPAPPRGPW